MIALLGMADNRLTIHVCFWSQGSSLRLALSLGFHFVSDQDLLCCSWPEANPDLNSTLCYVGFGQYCVIVVIV